MKFLQAIRNASNRLNADLADSELFDQMVERGRFREWAVERVLRPHIPDGIGISSGLVFSSDGNSSCQLDLVLYDKVFGNSLFRDSASSLLPAESVYGAIEIKSKLDMAELQNCIDNASSLKQLQREVATAACVTPFCELRFADGLAGPTEKVNYYFHGVFAFDSIDPQSLANDLTARSEARVGELPDYLWVYKKNAFILPFRKTPSGPYTPAPLGVANATDIYAVLNMGEDLLPIMVVTLNAIIGQIRLKAPNYNEYWQSLFEEATENNSSATK